LEKQYQDAVEARDEALKQFGFDHDPLDEPIRMN
jgi:hypothetical protein